jgi:hypothetical protein
MLKTISAQGHPNGITSLILLISLRGALAHLKPVSFLDKTKHYPQNQLLQPESG